MTQPASSNPILRAERLARGINPRPAPKADTALVFTDSKGQVFAPGRPVTVGEKVFGGLRRLYEVDLADHVASFQCDLPCRGGAHFFHAQVRLSWRVHDPEEVVRRRLDDGDAASRHFLEGAMIGISREYDLEAVREAEQAIIEVVGDHPLQLERGITIIECRVQLLLDQAAKDHLAKLTRSAHAGKEQAAEHSVQSAAQQYQLELDRRQRDEETRIAQATEKSNLEMARLRHEQELALALARENHELAMKQQRMIFYQQAIQHGNSALLLLQLVENPGDVRSVIDLLLSQETTHFENNRAFLETLGNAGLLQDADVDMPRKEALENLVRSLRPNPVAAIIGGGKPAIAAREESGAGPALTGPTAAGDNQGVVTDAEVIDEDDDEDEDER